MVWFLYDRDPRHERVKHVKINASTTELTFEKIWAKNSYTTYQPDK